MTFPPSPAGPAAAPGTPAPTPVPGAPAPAPAPAGPTNQPPAAPAPTPVDKGYPDGTPLEQMTGEQREAYWKHQARKHEDRVKSYGGLTAEELTALRDKASKHDALERELMSDKDKAVAEAKDSAVAEANGAFMPLLVNAKLEAAAARKGISPEALEASIQFLDTSKFLTGNGKDVDAAKVSAFIEGIAPGKGTTQERRGPTATGHAAGPGARQTGKAGEAGRAEAERRFGKKKTGDS